ncbi:MurR/RpiR family transcriptional regulator [Candidatus Enterococcus ferrettii]|uniref:MurR/RpiR family transcriptional regulator n=1 Tax=Candidatus Enterococcus ferrettii TaxID=2815324 RepID=A0ABV0EM44_9ENTE|nr:MurR/RpiR family transcriptional regulator [Enterococcus sp. 665A]MBO1341448.1 MurR/RpiR family transcriptional regulator [Enterococcus sp. 665A]
MNLFKKFAEMNNLTNNEKALVNYILSNPTKTLTFRAQELADAAFVSVAALYRFINKLELTGMGELKVELVSSLKETQLSVDIDYDYPILESDTPFQITENLGKIYKRTIDETLSFSDPEELATVSQALLKAKIIDVYAASANLFFAQNFKFQMQEIGILVNVPEEDYIQRLSAANSDSEHLAIVVSYGGRGQTLNGVVKILHENQIPMVLITSVQDNPLAKYADYKIYMASIENHYDKVSSFSTRMSLLMVFDTLYAVYFNHQHEKNVHFKITNYQKMNKELR